jgi:hypothetical protein
MIRTITTAALLLVGTGSLLAPPAAAQSAGCTGDYVCSEPNVVATWPLDRWTTVRRENRQTAASK